MLSSIRPVAAAAPAARACPPVCTVRPFVQHSVHAVTVRQPQAVVASARKSSATVEVPKAVSSQPDKTARYETLIVLKPTLTDEERDQELARFETFLHQESCSEVKAMVRGRQRMAYPIKGNWEGIYVLFSFQAHARTAPKVQKLLSTPEAGSEDKLLRHMTFRY